SNGEERIRHAHQQREHGYREPLRVMPVHGDEALLAFAPGAQSARIEAAVDQRAEVALAALGAGLAAVGGGFDGYGALGTAGIVVHHVPAIGRSTAHCSGAPAVAVPTRV